METVKEVKREKKVPFTLPLWAKALIFFVIIVLLPFVAAGALLSVPIYVWSLVAEAKSLKEKYRYKILLLEKENRDYQDKANFEAKRMKELLNSIKVN